MFVVIEWNQASGRPRLADGVLYHLAGEAEEAAQEHLDQRGERRERYTVHSVDSDQVWPKEEGGW